MVDVLENMDRVRLVAKVSNGWDVVQLSARLKPDIILADFSLPGLSGLEVTSLVKRELPQIAVIILLDEEDAKYIKAVEQCGAKAHLVKSRLAKELPSLLDKLRPVERKEHSN
jgi:DNA-binding NarL/FixJ family response regulator